MIMVVCIPVCMHAPLHVFWQGRSFWTSTLSIRRLREGRQRGHKVDHEDQGEDPFKSFNDWGGGSGDVTSLPPFWEGTARK